MVDESLESGSTAKASGQGPQPPLPSYVLLRWTIRLTGVLLMFGGAIYLIRVAWSLLFEKHVNDTPFDSLFAIIVSLGILGLGIFVLRTGLRMLRTVDASSIGSFSFVFALIYTWILTQVLPLSDIFIQHQALFFLLLFLYFGLSYWILKRILLALLLPKEER